MREVLHRLDNMSCSPSAVIRLEGVMSCVVLEVRPPFCDESSDVLAEWLRALGVEVPANDRVRVERELLRYAEQTSAWFATLPSIVPVVQVSHFAMARRRDLAESMAQPSTSGSVPIGDALALLTRASSRVVLPKRRPVICESLLRSTLRIALPKGFPKP